MMVAGQAKNTTSPEKVFEDYLHEELEFNQKNECCLTESKIIKRLLARSSEMTPVYHEAYSKLKESSQKKLLSAILSTADTWNPESTKQIRNAQTRLQKINQEIEQSAHALSELLIERNQICNKHSLTFDRVDHIVDFINRAADRNSHFSPHLKEKLQNLSYEYEFKCWPCLSDIFKELSEQSTGLEIYATDPMTEEAIEASRTSLSDFLKALLARFRNSSVLTRLKLSDNSMATIVNCSLDLEPDNMIDSAYVKRFRQRLRTGK